MVMMKRIGLACCLLLLALNVRAELVVEVTQGVSEPTPVAVVPFGWNGSSALPEDVARVVDQDLGRSGFFKAVPRNAMLGMPSQQEDVYFRDWPGGWCRLSADRAGGIAGGGPSGGAFRAL